MTKIPGKLKEEDLDQLIELVKDKAVLMLGCYCGRALVEVAKHARRVWVLDNFKYPGGVEGVVEELKANVDRHVPEDKRIDLLYGTPDSWGVPPGSEDLRKEEVEVVYQDADRDSPLSDAKFVWEILHRNRGIYAWHTSQGNLLWAVFDPVKCSEPYRGGVLAEVS